MRGPRTLIFDPTEGSSSAEERLFVSATTLSSQKTTGRRVLLWVRRWLKEAKLRGWKEEQINDEEEGSRKEEEEEEEEEATTVEG